MLLENLRNFKGPQPCERHQCHGADGPRDGSGGQRFRPHDTGGKRVGKVKCNSLLRDMCLLFARLVSLAACRQVPRMPF